MCSRLVNANLVLANSTKNSTRGGEELKISKTETVSRPQVLPRSEKIILIGEVIIQIIQLMCSRLVNANLVLAHSIKNSTRGGEELKISKTETVSRPQGTTLRSEKIILIGDVILQIIQLMCSRLVNANLVLAHSTKNSTRGGEELKISKTETVSRPQVLPRSEKIILIGEVIIQIIQLMCSRLVNANLVLAHSIKNSTRGGEELKISKTETVSNPQVLPH